MAAKTSSAPSKSSKVEASSPETSPDRLKQLADESAALAKLVAANATCPSDLLSSLAEHKDAGVRKAVVANPGTPLAVALGLAAKFPLEFVSNPAFEVYLLEKPDLMSGFNAATLRKLVRDPDCPEVFWKYASRLEEPSLHLELLRHVKLPKEIVDRLRESADKDVAEAARWHVAHAGEQAPADWRSILDASIAAYRPEGDVPKSHNDLAALIVETGPLDDWPAGVSSAERQLVEAADHDPSIQRALARNPNTPTGLLELLSDDADEDVRVNVSRNLNAQEVVLERLAADRKSAVRSAAAARLKTFGSLQSLAGDKSGKVRQMVAANPNTPVAVLELLAKDERADVVMRVAENPAAPEAVRNIALLRLPSLLDGLAKSGDSAVRRWVADNPRTPAAVLERSAGDKDKWVRKAIAQNPTTPVAVLERLARDKEWYVRGSVAENPATPVAILERLARDEEDYEDYEAYLVREAVAKNLATPVAVLERLAGDENQWVRKSVAENPATPVAVLERHAGDESYQVRQAVAVNSATPVAVLERLAGDEDWEVRKAVAVNPATPVAVLEHVARDEENYWRLAGNPATPVAVLERLAGDQDEGVRKVVAVNPATPVVVLERLAGDKEAVVREAVAINPMTPVAVLEQFALDEEQDVRRRVAGNPNTPAAVLEQLAGDKNQDTRKAVAGNPNTPASALERLSRQGPCVGVDENTTYKLKKAFKSGPEAINALRNTYLERVLALKLGVSRLLALQLEFCPAGMIQKFTDSPDWRERAVLAAHPNCPSDCLPVLAGDANIIVRAAAVSRDLQ